MDGSGLGNEKPPLKRRGGLLLRAARLFDLLSTCFTPDLLSVAPQGASFGFKRSQGREQTSGEMGAAFCFLYEGSQSMGPRTYIRV